MSIILHLARTELLRLRWWSLAWCLIQGFALIGLHLEGSESGVFYSLGMAHSLLIVAWAFFLGIEVWAWAAPCGPERFWPTRPISLQHLLLSRVLVLGVLVVLGPLCVSLPFWISWHLEPIQYSKAILSTLTSHVGGLAAAFLVCLLNPFMERKHNRFLYSLLTVFVIALPVQFIGLWIESRKLLRSIPLPVREGGVYVLVLSFLVALVVFFVRRSRAQALTLFVALPLLSVPFLYLLPVRTRPFPDKPQAIAALGTLENLEIGNLSPVQNINGYTLSRRGSEFTVCRSDASAGPLWVSLLEGFLVQEENRVPVSSNCGTPRLNPIPNDVAFYEAGERRLRGSIFYRDENLSRYVDSNESPLSFLKPDKPVSLQGRLLVTRLEQRKGRELLVGPEGSRQGDVGLHLRRLSKNGPETIEVYTDYKPYLSARDGETRFRVVDALTGERARERRSSSYQELVVLGVAWRSNRETFSPTLPGQEQATNTYRVIEYVEHRRDLGFVTIDSPVTVRRGEDTVPSTIVGEGKK